MTSTTVPSRMPVSVSTSEPSTLPPEPPGRAEASSTSVTDDMTSSSWIITASGPSAITAAHDSPCFSGPFSGPLKQGLSWSAGMALGPDAVMIHDEDVMSSVTEVLDASARPGGSGGNVLGSEVLTDTGILLGTVVDVILEVSEQRTCDVVGYEVSASEPLGTHGAKVFLPLPVTLSASGEHVMVPAAAKDFVAHDLAGFGAAVQAFRKHLGGPS